MGAAKEMDILDNIAPFVDAGQCGSQMEINMGQEAMLGIARPNADRSRVPSGVDSSQRCGGGASATGLS